MIAAIPPCNNAHNNGKLSATGQVYHHLTRPNQYRTFGGSMMADSQHICSVAGCGNKRKARSLCSGHYKRWLRTNPQSKRGTTPSGAGLAFVMDAVNQDTSDCIIWPFGVGTGGYGTAILYNGKKYSAHRLALILSGQPMPESNSWALHSPVDCHNRACVNPKHLRWGSAQDNTSDRFADGTIKYGETCTASKLTDEKVMAIRSDERTHKEIALEYGVTRQAIGLIMSGKTWSHIL